MERKKVRLSTEIIKAKAKAFAEWDAIRLLNSPMDGTSHLLNVTNLIHLKFTEKVVMLIGRN